MLASIAIRLLAVFLAATTLVAVLQQRSMVTGDAFASFVSEQVAGIIQRASGSPSESAGTQVLADAFATASAWGTASAACLLVVTFINLCCA